jgi:hypothetical protein
MYNMTGWKNLGSSNGMVYFDVDNHGDPIQKAPVKKADLKVLHSYYLDTTPTSKE